MLYRYMFLHKKRPQNSSEIPLQTWHLAALEPQRLCRGARRAAALGSGDASDAVAGWLPRSTELHGFRVLGLPEMEKMGEVQIEMTWGIQ